MKVKLTKNIVINRAAHKAGDELDLTGSDLIYVLDRNLAEKAIESTQVEKPSRTRKKKED